MNKIYKLLIVFFALLFTILPVNAKSSDITVYFFRGEGCPHCAEEEKFLDKVIKKNKNVKVVEYEVWYNEENANFMNKVKDKLNIKENGVPLTIVGSSYLIGYSSSMDDKFNRMLNYYKNNYYTDVVSLIKNDKYTENIPDNFSKNEAKSDKTTTIKLPIFGKVNLKKLSIPYAASIIGFVDGFNPCAMWVLLFLISMLFTMEDRRRMWILGISFLLTSGIVYMAIMLSWFGIAVNITTSIFVRNIIAIIAIIASIFNISKFFTEKDSGCSVTDNKKRRRILVRIQKFTHEKNFILAILGVILLAVSVNVVELACSVGLPLVFTQILAINHVSFFMTFIYTLIYIIFFLIDDILVFIIAMKTMKVTAISTKYNKFSHIIGGVIMLIIGILLLFKPGWLMFNFN